MRKKIEEYHKPQYYNIALRAKSRDEDVVGVRKRWHKYLSPYQKQYTHHLDSPTRTHTYMYMYTHSKLTVHAKTLTVCIQYNMIKSGTVRI